MQHAQEGGCGCAPTSALGSGPVFIASKALTTVLTTQPAVHMQDPADTSLLTSGICSNAPKVSGCLTLPHSSAGLCSPLTIWPFSPQPTGSPQPLDPSLLVSPSFQTCMASCLCCHAGLLPGVPCLLSSHGPTLSLFKDRSCPASSVRSIKVWHKCCPQHRAA